MTKLCYENAADNEGYDAGDEPRKGVYSGLERAGPFNTLEPSA